MSVLLEPDIVGRWTALKTHFSGDWKPYNTKKAVYLESEETECIRVQYKLVERYRHAETGEERLLGSGHYKYQRYWKDDAPDWPDEVKDLAAENDVEESSTARRSDSRGACEDVELGAFTLDLEVEVGGE